MKRRPMYYILDGHEPKPVNDVIEWAEKGFGPNRQVGDTDVGDVRVSTVFLGLDHDTLGKGPPILFETMVFGGIHDQWMDRCATWDEAVAMHARAVEMVKSSV